MYGRFIALGVLAYALFFLGLLPVSQVVPIITLKQDRYLYFPLLGLAGLAAEGACLVVDRFPRCRHLVTCALTLLVLALPILTLEQLRHWQDDLSLWSYTVKRDPDNTLGWLLLSKVQTRLGDGGQARAAWLKYNYLKENHGPLRGYEDQ